MVSLTAKPSAGLSPLIASQPSNFIHKSYTNRAKKSGLAVPQKYCCCRLGAILLAQTRKLQPSPLCQNLMSCPILHLVYFKLSRILFKNSKASTPHSSIGLLTRMEREYWSKKNKVPEKIKRWE